MMKRTFKRFCFQLAMLTGIGSQMPRARKQETLCVESTRNLHRATVTKH